jgi:predicted transcriptional regulator
MKATANNKVIAQKIINAITHGAHTKEMIIRNQELETELETVCKVIEWLQNEGIIEYHNRNMAHEYGYFITEEGWRAI